MMDTGVALHSGGSLAVAMGTHGRVGAAWGVPTCCLGGKRGSPNPEGHGGMGTALERGSRRCRGGKQRSPRRTSTSSFCSIELPPWGYSTDFSLLHIYSTDLPSAGGGIVSLVHRPISSTQ